MGDWVQSLGWDNPLEKGMSTISSILAWRIPWTGAWWAIVHGVTENWTRLSNYTFTFTMITNSKSSPGNKQNFWLCAGSPLFSLISTTERLYTIVTNLYNSLEYPCTVHTGHFFPLVLNTNSEEQARWWLSFQKTRRRTAGSTCSQTWTDIRITWRACSNTDYCCPIPGSLIQYL